MNDPTIEKEILDSYLKKIAENLYFSIQSISVLRTIDKNIELIKDIHFEHFFIPLQRPLINDVILSLTKIFENKSSVNLRKVQNYINSNQKNIRLESNCINSIEKYKSFDFSSLEMFKKTVNEKIEIEPFKDYIHTHTYDAFYDKQFLKVIDENINKIYIEFEEDLSALKELRDKNIAHTDKKPISSKTTWAKVDNLIEFIKEYVDMIYWVYLSTAWSGDNSSAFSMANAEGTSYSLERLLKEFKEEK